MPVSHPARTVLAGLSFALLAIGCSKKKADQDGPPPPLGAPDHVLTAVEFAAEFKKDSKAAEAKYQDKVVELSGTVQTVGRDDDEAQGLVSFASGEKDKLFPVCACLFADRNIAEKVGKDQTVRVRGRFLRHFVFPSLNQCEIVEKGPETLVPITAEQLAKEHTADQEACEAKYKKKPLLVSGVVSAVKTDENKVKFIELQGDGQTVIEIRYIAWSGKWPIDYKVGDKARLTGELLTLRTEKNLLVVVMDVALDG